MTQDTISATAAASVQSLRDVASEITRLDSLIIAERAARDTLVLTHTVGGSLGFLVFLVTVGVLAVVVALIKTAKEVK